MKQIIILILLILFIFITGCSTVLTHRDRQNGLYAKCKVFEDFGIEQQIVFSGSRRDLSLLLIPFKCSGEACMGALYYPFILPLAVIDLPLSFLADSLLLPYTLYMRYKCTKKLPSIFYVIPFIISLFVVFYTTKLIIQRRRLFNEFKKYRLFWRRFFSLIIDFFILLSFVKLETYIRASNIGATWELVLGLFTSLLIVGYSVLMHGRYGQTLGKMVTRIKVIDISEEKKITYKQASLRDILPILLLPITIFKYYQVTLETTLLRSRPIGFLLLAALLWLILEIITMFFDKKRRSVQDLIAGSVVVKTKSS